MSPKTLLSVGLIRLLSGSGVGGAGRLRSDWMVVLWGLKPTEPASASTPIFTFQRRSSTAGMLHTMGVAVGLGDGDGLTGGIGDTVGVTESDGEGVSVG